MKTFGQLKEWLARTKVVESIVAELHALGHTDDEEIPPEHVKRLTEAMEPRKAEADHEGPAEDPKMIEAGETVVVHGDNLHVEQSSQPEPGGTPPGEGVAASAAEPSPPTLTEEVKPA